MAEERGETALARLIELVGDYETRKIGEAALRAAIAADPGLIDLARQEAGGRLTRGSKVIDFGASNQIGQVQVRDVAGGDIINLTINLAARSDRPPPAGLDSAEIAHKRTLIAQHQKMLNALELQAAKFGIYAPPHITIEIEDTRRKIAELRREIGEG
jgi:hypothetical protein